MTDSSVVQTRLCIDLHTTTSRSNTAFSPNNERKLLNNAAAEEGLADLGADIGQEEGHGCDEAGDDCDVTVPPSCLNPDGTLIAGGGGSSAASGGSTPNIGPSINKAGSVGMGRTCQADADCHLETAFCISYRNVCASKGSCNSDADCTNPNNQTPRVCEVRTYLYKKRQRKNSAYFPRLYSTSY